jgi:polar amino acid transport system permease protein
VEYTFHFIDVWTNREELLWGAWLTVRLSAISMVLSLLIAIFGALARTSGPKWLRGVVAAYVEFVRNTPFLVQVFVIFFGLPALGLRLEAKIVRAGIQAIDHGQVEAAYALGLHKLQAFRSIVLPQALRAVFTPLGSQFILLMLNSSIVSVISAEELTAAAQDIQSRTFRSFEVYIVTIAIYLVLSISFSAVFAALNRIFFPRLETR